MLLISRRFVAITRTLPQTIPRITTRGMSDKSAEGSKAGGKSILNWVEPGDKSGEFKRKSSAFRSFIENKPGAQFPPEANRYHLYVSYACPWAHRTLIVRQLKGLEKIIPFTSVHWHMQEKGWRFATKEEVDNKEVPGENVTQNPVHPEFSHLQDLYYHVNSEYEGRFLVPTLYDTKTNNIVSNESSEIIRMMYTEFDDLIEEKYKKVDLFPQELRKQIEEDNEYHYNEINNGVYKSGFATTQEAYEKNVRTLFKALDKAEAHLESQAKKNEGPYYYGSKLTEVDVRLYTTIIRFDAVYHQHFKCNLKEIRSGYPALHKWVRHLYWKEDAFGSTTQFEHIKRHYTRSHQQINPLSITPLGPDKDILGLDEEVAAVGYKY